MLVHRGTVALVERAMQGSRSQLARRATNQPAIPTPIRQWPQYGTADGSGVHEHCRVREAIDTGATGCPTVPSKGSPRSDWPPH